MLHWFGRSLTFHTTGKCPASRLVSRLYGTGYNALDDCRYRRLVLAVLLRLNSRLPPFWQAFRSALPYSVVKVRLSQHNQLKTKRAFEIFENLARFSPPSGDGTITEKNNSLDELPPSQPWLVANEVLES